MSKKPKRVTIDQLEKILNTEEETNIWINPDGSIRTDRRGKQRKKPKVKILTMKEALGGEYGCAL